MAIEGNLSAVLHGINEIRLEERPIPAVGDTDVMIRMDSVGICGSDVHYWSHGAIGDFIVKAPMVLGHESAGTVVETGKHVTHLKNGDRVAIEPGVPCRYCDYCKTGRYNLCLDMKFAATPPIHGTLTRRYVHPADFCYKLPDNVSMEEGALLEPLAVGVHACRRAGITIGKNVLILGAGPIGLVNLLVAKAMGAAKVIISDIDTNRLKTAKSMGADEVIHAAGLSDAKDGVAEVAKYLPGLADITIECSGAETAIRMGVLATKSGGCLVLVGLGKPEINMPIVSAAVREVDIRGIFRYANCYPTALELVATGAVDVKPLITHRFDLEQAVQAFETSKSGKDNCIKVMIKC